MARNRYDDDDDDTPPPRKKKRRRRGPATDSTPIIVGGVILGVCFLAAIIVLVASSGRSSSDSGGSSFGGSGGGDKGRGSEGPMVPGPGGRLFPEEMLINDAITFGSQFNPPLTWTHQDLADHLRKKGWPVTIRHDPSLGSTNGQGVWFEDARPDVTRKGKTRVYRCPSKRDAARQIVAMQSHLWLPILVGHFAVGHDGKDNPSDEDLHFDSHVRNALR